MPVRLQHNTKDYGGEFARVRNLGRHNLLGRTNWIERFDFGIDHRSAPELVTILLAILLELHGLETRYPLIPVLYCIQPSTKCSHTGGAVEYHSIQISAGRQSKIT